MATENKKYIPALRFPEFQNDGEWALTPIGKYYKVQGGFAFRSSEFKKSGTPIIRISNIPNEGIYIDISNSVYYDRIENEVNFLISKGDLLIAMSGATTGKTAVYNQIGKAYLNQRVGLFKSTNSHNYYPFICQWVKSNYFYAQLKRTLAAGAQPNISSKDIESFIWAYPNGNNSFAEQKKIADCLSSLDKYIDATKRKLELLQEHKKGLMQRLFPAKGKTTPELRFPEFQNDGEWVEVPFGSIINVNSGKDYKHLDVGNIPVYGTGGYMLSVNDRLSDIDAVGIGRKGTIDKPQYLKAPFWTVDTLFFLTSSKNYDIRYLYYLCQTIPWKTYGEQTGVPSISKNSIDKLDVVITTNLTEQQKIAQSLLHLDNAMDAIEKKIHLLETHKYGLMQNLFPNLNNY